MSIIWSQFCIEKSRWDRESCPLSGIEKHPPLGGIKVMLDTIRNTTVVRCSLGATPSQHPERGSGLLRIVDLFCTVSKCGAGTVCEQCANTN